MEEKKTVDYIKVLKSLWSNRRMYYVVVPVVFVVSCLLALSVPRYYTCNIKLAPEYDLSSMNNLSSLASQFGFDLGDKPTTDAISPDLYPDLIESTEFMVSLFDVKVESSDGKIKTTYYDYMANHQKYPWWTNAYSYVKRMFSKSQPTSTKVDVFRLTKKQSDIVRSMISKLKCTVDKKTDVISLTVKDQDPLISATVADAVREKLQFFITQYRTKKSKVDVDYYSKLLVETRAKYDDARIAYARFSDSNQDAMLQSVQSKIENLENEMQLAYNTYTSMATQLQAAKAKLQARTPAFSILQGATVPVKHSGPKRMLFVFAMTVLAIAVVSFLNLRKILNS